MHNRNEVQPPISLPDLSAWHRVPVGATIPANTPYAYVDQNCATLGLDGAYVDITVIHSNTYYTQRPIVLPLPTEEGATIMASDNKLPPHVLLTCVGGGWFNRYGDKWAFDDIRAWALVTIGETVVMP